VDHLRQTTRGLVLLGALSLTTTVLADDQDVIDYRKHVMKTLGEQLGAVHMMLDKKAPADAFVTDMKVIALAAGQAKSAFEPKVAGGNSKPEVWSNWADFAKRLDTLTAASASLAKAAQDGGPVAVGPKLDAALDCKGCHDLYMVPAKK
jgi:cytochrome c556